MIKCGLCSETVESVDRLENHRVEEHTEEVCEASVGGLRLDCVCDECGVVFERLSSMARTAKNQFCEKECADNYRRIEDEPARGSIYLKKREQVIQRDGEECVDCGLGRQDHHEEFGKDLHSHHIDKPEPGQPAEVAHATENMVTLCDDCHKDRHGGSWF